MAYDDLLRQKELDKDEWERRRHELEGQLNALAVRNSEAERLFKHKEQQLGTRLVGTQQALDGLEKEHKQLQSVSAEQLKQLQERLAQVQQACKDLEAERAELQHKLRGAEVTAQARREAERRVAELEAGIAATQARAQEWIKSITKQRDQASADRDQLKGRLADTQRALADQNQKCQDAEIAAKHLLLSNYQLSHSLNLERIINEPLRHTNHATTTLNHIMRSFAAPIVPDRSRMPLHGVASPVSPPYVQLGVEVSPSHPLGAVARHISTSMPQQEHAPQEASAADMMEGDHSQAVVGVSSTLLEPCNDAAADDGLRHASPVRGGQSAVSAPATPYIAATVKYTPNGSPGVPQPENIQDVGRSALTRLGRAWATTTTTSGKPHSVFLDNLERFVPLYAGAQHTARVAERPRSAGPRARSLRHAPSVAAVETLLCCASNEISFGPWAQASVDIAAGSVEGSPSRGYRRPSDAVLRTYHETRSASATMPGSPAQRQKAGQTASSPVSRQATRAVPRSPAPPGRSPASPASRQTVASSAAPANKTQALRQKPTARPLYAPDRRLSSSTSSSDTTAYAMSSGSHSTVQYE